MPILSTSQAINSAPAAEMEAREGGIRMEGDFRGKVCFQLDTNIAFSQAAILLHWVGKAHATIVPCRTSSNFSDPSKFGKKLANTSSTARKNYGAWAGPLALIYFPVLHRTEKLGAPVLQ
jgi:hypothetical protein